MGTASGSDYGFLQAHEFFGQYFDIATGFQKRLIQLAKESFQDLKQVSNLDPEPIEVAVGLEIDLTGSVVFKDLVVALCKHINFPNPDDSYWPEFFAGPVARFLVDNEWDDIIN